MKRNSKLLSIFVAAFALALAFALAGCGQQGGSSAADSSATATSATSAAATAGEKTISCTMTIDATEADKGMLLEGPITVAAGATVYQALLDTGIDLVIDATSGTVFIDGIGGVVASEISPQSGWLFYVNGEMPAVGADQVELKDGDEIVWKFYADYNTAF